MSDVHNLMDAAASTKVAVIGAGIAGLVVAYDCAKLGMPVEVFEATDRPGGMIRTVALDGVSVDAGASAFAADGAVAALLEQLTASGATFHRVTQASAVRHTTSSKGSLVPLPAGVVGVPANPFLAEVVRIVGWAGAWRGYLDRLRPPLTIGHEENLERLVAGRLGAAFAERLVAPVTRGRFGLAPADVDVDVAAPALNAALTRAGSLTGGAGELLEAEPATPPQSLRGGLGALVDELVARIVELGGTVHLGRTVTALRRDGAGWQLAADTAPDVAGGGGGGQAADAAASADAPLTADVVFVATGERQARALLAGHAAVPVRTGTRPSRILTILAVVDQSSAEPAPWGSGVYPQDPGALECIDDLTTAWAVAVDGRRVVRARVRVTAASADLDSAAAAARAEIEQVLGTRVISTHDEVFEAESFPVERGFAAWVMRASKRAGWPDSLDAVGGWLSGSDLDQVIAAAHEAGERVRRASLFS